MSQFPAVSTGPKITAPVDTCTREAAYALAVRYHAYRSAIEISLDAGIILWGELLIESQHESTVYLYDTGSIRKSIAAARARQFPA